MRGPSTRELFAGLWALVFASTAGCLRTISEASASGVTSAGTASGSSSTSGAGTGSSGGSSGGATNSSTGGHDQNCRGVAIGVPCTLPDGGRGGCFGEVCRYIDFSSDPQNCGWFGVVCPAPAICADSLCFEAWDAGIITCQDGKTKCGPAQICVPEYGCLWQSCAPADEDQLCELPAEICDLDGCQTSGVCCQQSCLSLFGSDPLDCGGCDVACPSGAICVQGKCEVPEARCDSTDNNGLCVTPSGNPGACCLSRCAETLSDPAHCGGCAISCPIGSSCQQGICGTDAGSNAGCGTAGPSECPPGTSCSRELFVSPCFSESCPMGSDGIGCIRDGGDRGGCCNGACGFWAADGGCSG